MSAPADLDAIEARCHAAQAEDASGRWTTGGQWVFAARDLPALVAVLRELRALAYMSHDGHVLSLSAYGWRQAILRLTGGES